MHGAPVDPRYSGSLLAKRGLALRRSEDREAVTRVRGSKPPSLEERCYVVSQGKKWQQALENSDPLQVVSIDSTQQAAVMFLSPFSITAFKISFEVNLTAALA